MALRRDERETPAKKPTQPVEISEQQPAPAKPATKKTDYVLAEPDLEKEFPGYKAPPEHWRPRSSSAKVEAPETTTHGYEVFEGDEIAIRTDGTLLRNGKPMRSIDFAARITHTPKQSFIDWIKNKTEFEGRPLESYYFPPSNSYFVSDESIERASRRFIKWPSGEPAGEVIIGKTKDRSGYIRSSEAANILHISRMTVLRWCRDPEARPTDAPLDVIKSRSSDYFYIRERDVYEKLKPAVPRGGLKRGPRPQLTPA